MYFDRLHPYPAMISSNLCDDIASEFVSCGDVVLDPFCGTGRVMVAAASRGGTGIGSDVNPLAVLISKVKGSHFNRNRFRSKVIPMFVEGIIAQPSQLKFEFEANRKVEWFSEQTKFALAGIVDAINAGEWTAAELNLLAVLFSATVRDVSFCRDDGWKLHRMDAERRKRFSRCPFHVFRQRLEYALLQIDTGFPYGPLVRAGVGDARDIWRSRQRLLKNHDVSVMFSSPPYGDSLSTVQYGGISSLCLGAVSNISRLPRYLFNNPNIDKSCLGGYCLKDFADRRVSLERYWNCSAPGSRSESAVFRFLSDYNEALRSCCSVMRKKSKVILVVGRRRVSETEVKIDRFSRDVLREFGYKLMYSRERIIRRKVIPPTINRNGNSRAMGLAKGRCLTMKKEYVLVFDRK